MRVGVIGCGAIAQLVHLPAYRDLEKAELVAVADVDAKRAEDTAKKFGAKYWYSDYKQLLAREDIDAVSICTPNFLHCEQAVAAAEAQKSVLLEKPMAVTLEECDQIIDACKKARVKLMIGFNSRFEAVNQKVKKLLEDGTIGNIFQIRCLSAYSGPYDFWPAVTDWFYDSTKVGGGVLIDAGIHYIDMVRWFMGDKAEVAEVTSIGGSLVKGLNVEDNAIVLLKFKHGSIGEIDVSWTYKGSAPSTEILGTGGGIFIRPPSSTLSVVPHTALSEDLKGTIFPRFSSSVEEVMSYQKKKVEHFVDCVLNDQEPLVSGYDGRASLEIVLAAYESMKTGSRVSLPLHSRKAELKASASI